MVLKGLFLNCSSDFFYENKSLLSIKLPLSNGVLFYDSHEWENLPELYIDDDYFCVSGWFIYKGKKNNLQDLASDLVNQGDVCLNELTASNFIIYHLSNNVERVITDPFCLNNHFIDNKSSQLRISPSVKSLFKPELHKELPLLKEVFALKGHLFGNYTLFEGIERLEPGASISIDGVNKYHTLDAEKILPLEDIPEHFSDIIKYWPYDERVLPISSGLDSRLILASGKFKYGYTYGPKSSPELTISSKFKEDFGCYESHGFTDVPAVKHEKKLVSELSFGTLKPIPYIYLNYHYVSKKFHEAKVLFDGYLGDVFQRATYIPPKGLIGELFKLFPFILKFNISSRQLIKLKYKGLSDDAMNLVLNDFELRTNNLNLNPYQAVTYYEFIFGRGGRYTIFGSNVLANQCFTVVCPFTSLVVFNSFIFNDYIDAAFYKTMNRLWSRVDRRYSSVPVESGYSPDSNYAFIPFVQFFYRFAFHIIPSRANYGVALKRVK